MTTTVSTPTLVPYEDAIARYDPVIGLEVHVELSTATKMFCGCSTIFGGEPNSQVCPVCLGLPGSLPVLNERAVEAAMTIGLALGCDIAEWCRFARKNYFYPDMPKDYQVSQYDEPIAYGGSIDIVVVTPDGPKVFTVGIERAHMEEDTGKSLHVGGATGRIHGAEHSLVDYNRAGIPLIEVVTKPVPGAGAHAPELARAYVTELRDLLRALGVSDVRMEEGSLRCDVNVSIAPRGSSEWGKRTETKNVNSLRSVERAVRYEISRQAAVLDAGGTVRQETRHWQEVTGTTAPGRSKEEAEDYRYFPEPDLVPIAPSRDWVERLRSALPELPTAQRLRLQGEWGLSDLDMQALVNAGALGVVTATVAAGAPPADARKWWLGELARRANEMGVEFAELGGTDLQHRDGPFAARAGAPRETVTFGVTPEHVARVAVLVADGTLNDKLARQVFEGILAGEGDVDAVIVARGLAVVSDERALTAAVDEAIAAQPEIAAKIRSGKVAAAGALVGGVMKATRGQADAARVRELVLARLAPPD